MKKSNNYFTMTKSHNLSGTIMVDGAKNSLLPIIIASLLTKGISYIYGVADIYDLHTTIYLLNLYNVKVEYNKKAQSLRIDSRYITNYKMSEQDFKLLRTSVLFAGPLMHVFGEFWLATPGGDPIGKRPIDIHLDGFTACGLTIIDQNNYIYIQKNKRVDYAEFFLSFPSVGATQNLLLYAAKNDGKITLYNAAQEPEVMELIAVLNQMGAHVQCFFGGTIVIQGTPNLNSFSFFIMPDRLEAATFLIAAAMTEGNIFLPNVPASSLRSCLDMLQKCGHEIILGQNGYGITCIGHKKKKKEVIIKTMPYPGFSTDYQALFLSLLTISDGTSYIYENIFENRFLHIQTLHAMGAKISQLHDNAVAVEGVDNLIGCSVVTPDIRSGASLILAGLVATGKTIIHGAEHILRGYSNIDKKLRSVGADIHFHIQDNDYHNYHPTIISQILQSSSHSIMTEN